ncbi:MAG: YihY/virulence factor BrkB family protein [Spirochaetes bacterium]|nr:YihY/virulence factor BrkB family protein [Spirochaetota bacterium]
MAKGKAFRQMMKSIGGRITRLLSLVYHGEETFKGPWRVATNVVKVFIVSGRKFMRDDCLTKASSITYTIILSLVPALTVGLTIFSAYYGAGTTRQELFDRILLFMNEHRITLAIDPILDALLGVIDNAAKIGGISAAVMIFSATAMLRSMEKSMNAIWGIDRGRPLVLKIVYYWAALTLGPVILAAGMTAAVQLSTVLSSPTYRAAQATADRMLWIVGDHASRTLFEQRGGKFLEKVKGAGTIDYDTQKIYTYDTAGKTFVQKDSVISQRELKKMSFRGVQFMGENGWIVGRGGIMLTTYDGGATWYIRKLGDFDFNDIRMVSNQRGFIIADRGVILSTANGGASWELREYPDRSDFKSIAFYGERGMITGSRGIVLTTENGGLTWEQSLLSAAVRNNRPVTLNGIVYINELQFWLLGDRGLLLQTSDGGKTWRTTYRENSILTAYFFNPDEGVIGGEDGLLMRTDNGGRTWERVGGHSLGISSLRYNDEVLWAVGDSGSVIASRDRGATWITVRSGKSFWYSLINFFAPFAVIWLLFLLTYITLPNTRVPFRPAALGASFTSAVWVAFILLFILYIKSFAQVTMAVYGALAAIPLFLLMVYASSAILLFGAVVSYTLMHPDTYRSLKEAFGDREDLHVYYAVLLLMQVYRKFESGGGATGEKELRRIAAVKSAALSRYIRLFLDEKLLVLDSRGNYLPGKSAKQVHINDLIESVLRGIMDMPVPPGRAPLRAYLGRLFGRIRDNRRKTVGDTTLGELMKKE